MEIRNNKHTKEKGEPTRWYIVNNNGTEAWVIDGWAGMKNKDISYYDSYAEAEVQVQAIRIIKTKQRTSDLASLLKHAAETRYDESEVLDAVIIAFGKETVLSHVKDECETEDLMDEEDMVNHLHSHGYNVVKTDNLAQQMELESLLYRIFPYENMRENNLHLNF